jgi:hypothetical protein
MLQSAYLIHEVVAGGAVALPVGGEGFATQQDLLDDQIRPRANTDSRRRRSLRQ